MASEQTYQEEEQKGDQNGQGPNGMGGGGGPAGAQGVRGALQPRRQTVPEVRPQSQRGLPTGDRKGQWGAAATPHSTRPDSAPTF